MPEIKPTEGDQRVVIFCLTLEVAKSVEPVKYFKADKVYMFHLIRDPTYRDFKKEVERVLATDGRRPIAVEAEVWDFAPTLKVLVKVIKAERKMQNKIFVDVHGPGAWSAAAMIACMMEGATPYFAKTAEHAINIKKVYYDRAGQPRGTVASIEEPQKLHTFKTDEPDEDEVKALKIWAGLLARTRTGKLQDTAAAEALDEAELLDVELRKPGETKVSQSAVMAFRRGYLEKWLEHGWVETVSRGRYKLTDYGKVVLDVFGGE